MLELVLAAAVFLATHVGVSSTGLRDLLLARLGEPVYRAVYSVVALATLVWLCVAYGGAPYVALWPPTAAGSVLAIALMLPAVALLVGGVSTPNPTAAAAPSLLRADQPVLGMLKVTRHPVMWAIGLWAIAHLAVNGDLASLVLFGAIGGLALGGTLLIDARHRRREPDAYGRFCRLSSNLPGAAIARGRQRLTFGDLGWTRLLATLALYLLLFAIHPWLFGVGARGALGG